MNRFRGSTSILLVAFLLLGVRMVSGQDPTQYSDWSAPVNLGSVINSPAGETGAALSKNGLSLYFSSNRPGGFGGSDIWVSQRPSRDAAWGTPQNLGPAVNTSSGENAPGLSIDGHRLFFNSNRPGGFGGNDIYVSRRHNKRDDFGWQSAENVGDGVNSAANEIQPFHFEDDATGATMLYFASDRIGVTQLIYSSTLQPDETFGPAVMEQLGVINAFFESGATLRRDGLEMIWGSFRAVSLGSYDLWVATRPSTSDSWSMPVNLGAVINGIGSENRPSLSFDGTELYFQSGREGGLGGNDLYVSTRTKLTGHGTE